MSICFPTRIFNPFLQTPQCRLAPLITHITHTLHQPHIKPFNSRTIMSNLPTTMKGVLIQRTGGIGVLEYKTDLPLPIPQSGEILVKNEFTGVNYIDT
jgi:hypothetical protein